MKLFQNKYAVLIVLALVWGTSFILIKKSVDVFSPYQVGALRVSMAGLVLMSFGIPALRKLDKKTLMWAAIGGCFGNFIPMFLFPMAEVKVSSSLAGILNSLVPIFTLFFGFLLFNTKSTKVQVLGAIIGFAGANVLMYFTGGSGGESHFQYALLIILATISYSLSGLIVKSKLNHVRSLELSGAVFSIWFLPALIILIFSGFFTEFNGSVEHWKGLGYVSILAFMGTAMAMILFYKLIQQTTAVFASSVTYLMPVVAVLWGILDGEEFNFWFIIGGFLILIGIYLIREKSGTEIISKK
ncbi:MAG: DMT family transporter [Flavobacteriaceae bacterium]|nr:DMT family transporter [Flavobacteriaceae bacterium]